MNRMNKFTNLINSGRTAMIKKSKKKASPLYSHGEGELIIFGRG